MISVLHAIAPGPIAGAERAVIAGCRALLDLGVRIRLLVIGEARVPALGSDFAELARSCEIPFDIHVSEGRIDATLRKRFAATSADVIHCHGYKACVHALASGHAKRRVVATHHGQTSHSRRARFYEWLEVQALRRFATVFAVSSAGRSLLEGRGVPSRRLRVVENMLSDPRFADVAPRQHSGAPELLYVGRLSPEKSLATAIDALAQSQSSARLTIVGDGPERAELEARVQSLGLGSRVHFAGFQSDVLPFLEASDALVLPSLREGLPMVVVESLSARRPVIASRVGSLPDLIESGVTGYLLAPRDGSAWTRAFDDFAEQRDNLLAGVQTRWTDTLTRFSGRRWAAQTHEAYVDLPKLH